MEKVFIATNIPVSDLRTRYVPGVRIRQGVFGLAPWLDLVLIVIYLVLLQSRIVLQPGVVVELPSGRSAATGLQSSMIAVVMASGTPSSPQYKVFFNNEQFIIGDEKRMDALKSAIAAQRKDRGETALTLYADKKIKNQHLMMLIQMAQEAGMLRVNLGTEPGDELK